MKGFCFGLLFLGWMGLCYGQGAYVQFTGNMGLVAVDGQHRVLMDALHDFYKADYVPTAPDSVAAWMAAGDFSLACISHTHGDHFDPRLTMDFLKAMPEGRVAGPQALADSLYLQGQVLSLKRRVHLLGTVRKAEVVYEEGGLRVTGMYVPHANRTRFRQMENIAWWVEFEEGAVLHLGDCAPNALAFKKLASMQESWDGTWVVVPFWLGLEEEGRRVLEWLAHTKGAGANLVFTHFPPENPGRYVEVLKSFFPQAVFATKPGLRLILY